MRINKKNNKLSLFDKRYNLYLEIRNSMSEFMSHNVENIYSNRNENIYHAFETLGALRDEVYYLFGEDIEEYYVQIINHAETILANLHNHSSDDFKKSNKWFIRQFENRELRKQFEKYLKLKSFGI